MGHPVLGAVTRDTFTVVKKGLLPREILLVRMTGLFQGKFPVLNTHGYVKKNKESAHDINVVLRNGFLLPKVR